MNNKTKSQYLLLTEFLAKTLGSEYEIALHDIDGDKDEIIYIANSHISGRNVGEPLGDKNFKFISDNTILNNDYTISNQGITKNNKVIRSSSFFIKDDSSTLTGMLCINFDGSKYVNLAKKILRLTHMENASIESESLHTFEFIENIPDSISDVTDDVIDDNFDYSDISINRLTQEEKVNIVRQLNDKGVFKLKGSVSEVAEKLEVSEPTLYRYIRRVTKEK